MQIAVLVLECTRFESSPVTQSETLCTAESNRGEVQVLLKALLFLPEASIPCLDALQALLIVHTPQRADFIRSQGAAKLCTVLGESAFSEDALQRGMELLCTLAWQLQRNGEGDSRFFLGVHLVCSGQSVPQTLRNPHLCSVRTRRLVATLRIHPEVIPRQVL